MSELKIEYINIGELKGYERNSRTHSEEQIQQIKDSILAFGFTNPLLIDEQNMIIAGHGRIEAGKHLGMEQMPCIVMKGLDENQKRALVIADNKIAQNAGWDYDLLKIELGDLNDDGFDLDLTGFNDIEIESMLGESEFEEPEINDLEEKKELYDNAEVKRIVLMYSAEDFDDISERAEKLVEELGVEDNSQLFQFLVESYKGEACDENDKTE